MTLPVSKRLEVRHRQPLALDFRIHLVTIICISHPLFLGYFQLGLFSSIFSPCPKDWDFFLNFRGKYLFSSHTRPCNAMEIGESSFRKNFQKHKRTKSDIGGYLSVTPRTERFNESGPVYKSILLSFASARCVLHRGSSFIWTRSPQSYSLTFLLALQILDQVLQLL